jgi:hypothetical protein
LGVEEEILEGIWGTGVDWMRGEVAWVVA